MATEVDHYLVLGVTRRASTEEIRRAYRALARQLHPDVSGNSRETMARMAEVNRAWSVLSDPVARREYDAMSGVSRSSVPGGADAQGDGAVRHGSAAPRPMLAPARFPWRAAIGFIILGVASVLVLHATSDPPAPGVPDQILESGSCVVIDAQQMAVEVACGGPHEYVVTQFISTDRQCPIGVASFKDRQGMGVVCVEPAVAPEVASTGSTR